MRIKNTLVSAPMAGITTPAFRVLVEEMGGCDLYFSEMINAGSLVSGGPYEKYYLAADPRPEKLVHQLVGGDEQKLVQAASLLDTMPGFGIDINMGCCAPEILRAGAGLRWMQDAARAQRLIARVRGTVQQKKLSVKLRLGEKEDGDYLVKLCKALTDEGIDFLTLHPRTRKDKFGRIAKWEYVNLLKRELNIPVIGNGDVKSFEDYSRVQERYMQDGVMVGRAAIKAPWIFAYFRCKQNTDGTVPEGRNRDKGRPASPFQVNLQAIAHRFLELLPCYQPEDFLLSRAKRFFRYFSENLLFGHKFYTDCSNAWEWSELCRVVERYFQARPEDSMLCLP